MSVIAKKIGVTRNPTVSDIKQTLDGGGIISGIGEGSISGIVKEDGIPVVRRVMLYERYSGILIRTVYSKADGTYSFKGINQDLTYYIVSIDEYNDGIDCPAVIRDRISGGYDKQTLG